MLYLISLKQQMHDWVVWTASCWLYIEYLVTCRQVCLKSQTLLKGRKGNLSPSHWPHQIRASSSCVWPLTRNASLSISSNLLLIISSHEDKCLVFALHIFVESITVPVLVIVVIFCVKQRFAFSLEKNEAVRIVSTQAGPDIPSPISNSLLKIKLPVSYSYSWFHMYQKLLTALCHKREIFHILNVFHHNLLLCNFSPLLILCASVLPELNRLFYVS